MPSNGRAKASAELAGREDRFHLRLAQQGEFGMQRQLWAVRARGTRHETGCHTLAFDNERKVTRRLA